MTDLAPRDGIGAAIRTLRLRRRLSTRALAGLAGVSQPLLSKIENGLALPSVLSLYAIAEALGVGPAELLPTGDEPALPTSHGIPLPAAEASTSTVPRGRVSVTPCCAFIPHSARIAVTILSSSCQVPGTASVMRLLAAAAVVLSIG